VLLTASRSSSNRSDQNVIAAEAWPSIRGMGLTLAPVETARLAAVCLRSCGKARATPAAITALSHEAASGVLESCAHGQ
jgi:hypothetical protein